MSAPAATYKQHSNSYDIFILVLTVFSLAIMGLRLLPVSPATQDALRLYDNLICIVFLLDFVGNMAGTRPRRAYFIGRQGWLDLLGSIPSFGFVPAAGLLRLARLSRLARITRVMRGQAGKELVADVIRNRSQYALFITVLSAFMVLAVASVLMVQFESRSPDSNIKTGGDAVWWGFTTITTVGYGDKFPVTFLGRVTAVFVMLAGVGIIGSLASILASMLVPQPGELAPAPEPELDAPEGGPSELTPDVAAELASIRAELAALRSALTDGRAPGT